MLVVVLGLGVVGASTAYAYFSQGLPSAEDFAKDPLPLTTKVYARDGQTLLYEFSEERRDTVKYDELPSFLIDATISAEDKTFWTNPGVDVLGILRAVYVDLFRSDASDRPQGASTITQQLVKQRLVGGEVSLVRKIKEALLAIEVTRTYSKKEILALYFNQVFYGNQAYGVKAAAQAYFGVTDLSKLTLAQAALLAGLPQAPSNLDPSQPQNLDRVRARRTYVLDQMVENGYVSRLAADAADAEVIKLLPLAVVDIRAPHFVFRVRDQLANIVGSESAISRGGYTVITSLDWSKQQEAEKQVQEWVEALHSRNVWNAALVSIDPKTGEILAYVGSVDYTNTTDPRVQGQFDVAGLGERQTGSAFKVFNYVTAMKHGATPATVVVDDRTEFNLDGPNSYRPENADQQYHGPLTMRQAIRESRNIPAIKFLAEYSGVDDTIATAKDMGITADFVKAQPGLSLTLGSVPVKLVDMASAYGVLANLGVRVEPTYILKVLDSQGRTVWEHADFEQRRVLSPEIAWLMTDILKDTTDPAKSYLFGGWTNIGRPAALKTGTTDNLKDVYSVGYTPQIVTGVWMGNSDGTLMDQGGFFSAMGPGQLWRDYMKAVLKDEPVQDWPRPANIVSAQIVSAPGAFGGYGSGLLPSTLSPFSITENFIKGTVPTRQDDWFRLSCPDATGARHVVMVVSELGPDNWKKDRDAWIADAIAGKYNYNRYNWPALLSDGKPCPSPSPSPSVSSSPRPSGSGLPTIQPSILPTRTPPPGQRTPSP